MSAPTLPNPVGSAPATPPGWPVQVGILTGRQLLVWLRDPATLISALVSPLLALLLFKLVLGDVIGSATGQNSAFGTVPLVILISAMFGSMAAAMRLNSERGTGLLARLATLPIHRTADLASRVAAELVRILVTTAILLVAGYLVGFRFTQGIGPALGVVGVALLFGAAFAVMVLALAVSFPTGGPILPLLSLISSVLMFFNSGFAPIDSYPRLLQPLVQYQPMTPAIDVMRNLAVGGPVAHNLLIVIAWSVALIALFTYPALRGYAAAATSRN